MRGIRGLILACHPLPTLAVTLLATVLSFAWKGSWALVAVTVVVGQLSIGWCDDVVDVRKDTGRADKPIVSGLVRRRTVTIAAISALVVSIPLSLANGVVPGLVHLVVVAAGWSYDLILERTVWSWLPYAVAFGALPAFVALAAGRDAEWWLIATGALLGVGAHLANVLPDFDADKAAGVEGLPQRLGRSRLRLITPVFPVAATVLLFAVRPNLAGAVACAVAGSLMVALIVKREAEKLPFLATILIALLDVALLIVQGG